uniref:Uncharacterized protein n=1 Tax=Oryza nivara TaxID=4536 RepID=A0A0E0HSF0_ORYNI
MIHRRGVFCSAVVSGSHDNNIKRRDIHGIASFQQRRRRDLTPPQHQIREGDESSKAAAMATMPAGCCDQIDLLLGGGWLWPAAER